MSISLDRDSACMGDDTESHRSTLSVREDMTIGEFVAHVREMRYLAGIAGGKATWILQGSRPLAIIAQQWREPKFYVDPTELVKKVRGIETGSRTHFHFVYEGQEDPETVYERFAPRPPKRPRFIDEPKD